MPDTPSKFYLTTPIYYVNARPHIGHAYSTIAADVIARRHRLLGDDTFFLTGTDEHGQKIQRAALAAGVPPQQYADQVSATFRDLWKRMGITNDGYIRTTDPRHVAGVQKLWRELEAHGAIYLSTYTGQYSVGEEMFVEGPPGTIGPDGKPTETVTEENYFFRLSDYQLPLIDLIESGQLQIQPDTTRNEVLSFLRGNISVEPGGPPSTGAAGQGGLSGEARPLSAAGNPYLPGALKDLSISRTTFDWGIPVPGNPKHVIYVWLDALANYMTAVGYGSDDPAEQESFKRYWPADLHLVGKEITRFHCVYWPAFLLALNPNPITAYPEGHSPSSGISPAAAANPEGHGFSRAENSRVEDATALPKAVSLDRAWAEKWLPKSVVANGWLLFEESKMSKSRGNVVRTETILDAFGPLCPPVPTLLSSRSPAEGSASPAPVLLKGTASAVPQNAPNAEAASAAEVTPSSTPLRPPTKAEQDLFAADVLRYYLLREIPFGQDGSFSFDALITRYNADLANGYGNLVSRTLTMIQTSSPNGFSNTYSARFSSVTVADGLQSVLTDQWYVGESIGNGEQDGSEVSLGDDVAHRLVNYDFLLAIREIFSFIRQIDGHMSVNAPWKLAKLDGEEARLSLESVLYTSAESIRIITALLYPILPYATASVWRQLGLGDIEDAARSGKLKNLQWGGLKPGTKLGPLAPIFPRADKGLAQIMTDMESPSTPEPTPTESVKSVVSPSPAPAAEAPAAATDNLQPETGNSPHITIDDFAKVDLRVAQIVVAERIPKADKLLRLEVDLGYERRQILAGIAEYYAPETLIGRKVVIVANLAPRKMRGLESNGMIVAASIGAAGAPVLAGFLEDVELGARLK